MLCGTSTSATVMPAIRSARSVAPVIGNQRRKGNRVVSFTAAWLVAGQAVLGVLGVLDLRCLRDAQPTGLPLFRPGSFDRLAGLPYDYRIDNGKVKPMFQAKLSSKFQLSIPKAIRDNLKLRAGQQFVLLQRGNIIELIPSQSLLAARGMLADIGDEADRDYRDRSDRFEP
jgi:AbrB family looped-hinge helix DNA binding protein